MGAPPQAQHQRTESRSSIQRVPAQPNLDATSFDGNSLYSASWAHDRSHHRDLAASSGTITQMSANTLPTDDMLLQAAPHLQSSRTYSMDSTMSASMNHSMSYQGHPGVMSQQSMSAHSSFMDMDNHSQSMERDDQQDGDSVNGTSIARKSTRSSANNELEMRQLYLQNKDRSLSDIAHDLHGNERGPQSERQRQAFAMLWIAQVCSKGKSSVPRGRVYANYASKCAVERVTVLNPASFGKLVRVIFPKLKTRRLGVRGESKYHYVDFMMKDEQPDIRDELPLVQVPLPDSAPNFNARLTESTPVPTARAALPSPEIHHVPGSHRTRSRRSRLSLYRDPKPANINSSSLSSDKIDLDPFLSDSAIICSTQDPLPLPKIEPFLPAGTDRDAAKSLEALYLSHCTSLVECVRFCREKAFFHLYTSFLGTLTMPVQRLFAHPDISPWIEECDFVLYQRMMRILHGLSLQVVPKPVLDAMRSISDRLVPRIRDAFQGQPQHVMRAKEAPAVIFAALLDRELRVNLAAHAAANMLAHAPNRNEMYLDFITLLSFRKLAENVPRRAMDEVADILLKEIRDLIAPAEIDWEVESQTIHGAWLALNGGPPPAKAAEADTTRVLDLWLAFLRSLPSRFPYASAADIVCYLDRVGSAIMRDLTIFAGKSFGTWWVTKCWIDEMMSFEAELGGFLRMTSTRDNTTAAEVVPETLEAPEGESVLEDAAGLRQGSEESNSLSRPQSPPTTARGVFPSCSPTKALQDDASGSMNPDDSGIGIRTPDEDFPMDNLKFDFSTEPPQVMGSVTDQPAAIS